MYKPLLQIFLLPLVQIPRGLAIAPLLRLLFPHANTQHPFPFITLPCSDLRTVPSSFHRFFSLPFSGLELNPQHLLPSLPARVPVFPLVNHMDPLVEPPPPPVKTKGTRWRWLPVFCQLLSPRLCGHGELVL